MLNGCPLLSPGTRARAAIALVSVLLAGATPGDELMCRERVEICPDRQDVARAYETLRTARELYSRRIGIAGMPSPTSDAFPLLLRQSDALELFTRLVSDATLAGQLYGLCGVYLLDQEKLEVLKWRYRDSEDQVKLNLGCMFETVTVAVFAGTRAAMPYEAVHTSLPEFCGELY